MLPLYLLFGGEGLPSDIVWDLWSIGARLAEEELR